MLRRPAAGHGLRAALRRRPALAAGRRTAAADAETLSSPSPAPTSDHRPRSAAPTNPLASQRAEARSSVQSTAQSAAQSASVSTHILPSSATRVGACITALSVVKLAHVGAAGAFIDRLLGIATCLFLLSAIASFAAMRRAAVEARLESAAETVFLIALALVTLAALGMAFEIA